MSPAAAGVNWLLTKVGLKLVRADHPPLIDMRGKAQDAAEAALRAGLNYAVIDVALEHCRMLHADAFPCRAGAGNPFVDTLVAFDRGHCGSYRDSPLMDFFEAWQPKSAAEALGLDRSVAPAELVDAEPYACVLPWDWEDPRASAERRRQVTDADHRRAGIRTRPEDGWKAWGPTSDAVGQLEFERLVRVFRSIKATGYRRSGAHDGDIGCIVLQTGPTARFLITPGHHRAAALAALGYRTAPVRMLPVIVRRDDAASWPNVRSGLFTEAAALEVFDRVHSGSQPAGCNYRPHLSGRVPDLAGLNGGRA